MRLYHSPKDYLEAARDPFTEAEELRVLASSSYSFVKSAVAEHPNTEADVLVMLIPHQIQLWNEQELAFALARRSHMPPHGLSLLAQRLPPVLNRARGHDYGLRAGIAVCSNPSTVLNDIEEMLSAPSVSSDFRRLLARETPREDVLRLLLADRSSAVQKRASERLKAEGKIPA